MIHITIIYVIISILISIKSTTSNKIGSGLLTALIIFYGYFYIKNLMV